ncbi:sortase domain-containing protein [Enterococcus sp. AZ109]|uniref:class F sortase n=1 Tax=Enterococcus sp. AZ109 TaxID=2774634 RepID=UPI003F226BE3
MTIPKLITVIAAVTSLTLFGNLIMLPKAFTQEAQTNIATTITDNEEYENKAALSSEINETSSSSEENQQAEEVSPTNEVTNESTSESTDPDSTSPVEEATIAEAAVVEEPEPVIESTIVEPIVEQAPVAEPVPQWQPNMLQIAGSYIPYSNAGQGSGQAVIDANHGAAATWGGSPVQSGADGMNTHIIGHNPGAFNALFSLGIGSVIEVSDASGQITAYTVQNIVTVDDSAYGLDGADYWDQITGTGGGERITLQTCINDFQNLIVFAA